MVPVMMRSRNCTGSHGHGDWCNNCSIKSLRRCEGSEGQVWDDLRQ